MGHTLRKYLSNRGSALFMVLSTMTALMVCCMAMYFSVVSSRSTQYAIFNQQQAYQSASSLSDALIASMYNHTGDFAKIGDKIALMKEGEVLTTNSNGFAAFDSSGSGKEDDDQLGAYMVTITRLPDETIGDGSTVKVFDIVVTSSVNGIKETTHNVIQFKETPVERPLPGPTNVFTATGYVPNDVFLDGGHIVTDVYFDNEYTLVNAYGGKSLTLEGNLSCGGSITLNQYIICKAKKAPVTYAIRGDYTNKFAQSITFPEPTGTTDLEKENNTSIVLIGGDCHLDNSASFNYANVYVLGDLYLNGHAIQEQVDIEKVDGTKVKVPYPTRFFVNGKVYQQSGNNQAKFIYCNEGLDESKRLNTGDKLYGDFAGTWEDYAQGKNVNGIMTKEEMISLLDGKTSSGTYYKWIVDEAGMVSGEKTIKFVADYTKDPEPTKYIEYGSAEDGKGCTLEDITMDFSGSSDYYDLTLVIDTGDDPNNVYTIKLKGNRNYLPDPPGTKAEDKKETFCWFPRNINVVKKDVIYDEIPAGAKPEDFEEIWAGDRMAYRRIIAKDTWGNKIYEQYTYQKTSHDEDGSIFFKVLVMGRGSVLFDIPDGVTYQDDTFLKVMHYGWYALKGGEETYFGENKTGKSKRYIIEHTAFGRLTDDGAEKDATDGIIDCDAEFLGQFIHHSCKGGDGCVYSEKATTEDCSICGGKTTNIICEDHGVVDTYCKSCQPNRGLVGCKDHTAYKSDCAACQANLTTGKCSNRLHKPKVDDYIKGNPDFYTKHSFMKGKDGKIIYPNVNLFLISCDENASIRFSQKASKDKDKTGKDIIQNSFFGYVYAPYMTFKAGPSNSGGGMVRLMGGMTVSDYIIDDSYSMLACWPDKIPEDLMGEASFENPIYGVANKSWKISLKGR